MPSDKLKDIFSEIIRCWRSAESQRMIFGINMPQTKQAISVLTASLEKVFAVYPAFSVILKDQAMEIVASENDGKDDEFSVMHTPANLPSYPKIFKQLNINSITLKRGTTEKELKEFFTALIKKAEELESEGGFKGWLQKQSVDHIAVDQMKFRLLKEDERVGAGKQGTTQGLTGSPVLSKQAQAAVTKLRDTAWSDYLSGKLGTGEFKSQYDEFIQ